MSVQSKAPGDAPSTGTAKTPAPNIMSRQSHTEVLGGPNYGGRVFDNPNTFTQSPMAQELERVGDPDHTLAQVRAKGTSKSQVGYSAKANGSTSDQLRAISEKNVPTHPHMSGAAKGPTIPSRLGGKVAKPIRQP
jgi:hypothetical protein